MIYTCTRECKRVKIMAHEDFDSIKDSPKHFLYTILKTIYVHLKNFLFTKNYFFINSFMQISLFGSFQVIITMINFFSFLISEQSLSDEAPVILQKDAMLINCNIQIILYLHFRFNSHIFIPHFFLFKQLVCFLISVSEMHCCLNFFQFSCKNNSPRHKFMEKN